MFIFLKNVYWLSGLVESIVFKAEVNIMLQYVFGEGAAAVVHKHF